MKLFPLIACFFFIQTTLFAQKSNALTGDWMRVAAMYANGTELPRNHPGRIFQRYSFVKNKVLVVLGSTTTPMEYVLNANQLKLGPIQTFTVEQQSVKEMVLLEVNNSIRYHFIPTDSFTISGIMKYQFAISDIDTVYTSSLGIEPVYTEGGMAFMQHIVQGFNPVDVSFEFTYVVQKNGTISAVEVNFSTNEKFNKRLIQLVKKMPGKWIPGSINGKPINVRAKGNITLTRSR